MNAHTPIDHPTYNIYEWKRDYELMEYILKKDYDSYKENLIGYCQYFKKLREERGIK